MMMAWKPCNHALLIITYSYALLTGLLKTRGHAGGPRKTRKQARHNNLTGATTVRVKTSLEIFPIM